MIKSISDNQIEIIKNIIQLYIPSGKKGLTPFVNCMDEKYIICNDTIINYRNYYVNAKSHLAKWTKRDKPFWYKDNINNE